jgi:hypothetical protein
MAHTGEEMTQHVAAHMCGEIACRDDMRLARRLVPEASGGWGVPAGRRRDADDVFPFLQSLRVMAWLVHPAAPASSARWYPSSKMSCATG